MGRNAISGTCDKTRLRREARARRDLLAARNGADAAERLSQAALSALALDPGTVVAGYWPIGSEIDDRPLLARLAAMGHPCCLPVVTGPNQALSFRRWRPGDDLIVAEFGIMTPPPLAETLVPTLVLVPLLAFDAARHRLGYGGGYYDRTLAALRRDKAVVAVGIAFTGQRLDRLPADVHDQTLDMIATEEGMIR